METIKELKETIKKVILESFKKSKAKEFKELNYVFTNGKSPQHNLKTKLKIFDLLDEYSQTFLSIHTRAKLTLREFQSDNFENNNYLELIRLILTLPEQLNSSNLKSINVKSVDNSDINVSKKIVVEDKKENIEIIKGTKLIKENLTGKKIVKQKIKEKEEFDDLADLEFEEDFDEELESNEFESEAPEDDSFENLEL